MDRHIFNRRFERRSSIAKHISCSTSNPSVAFCIQHLLDYCHLFRNIQLMKTQLRPALTIFALLTIITGVIYPLLVTGISQVAISQSIQWKHHHRRW